VVWCSRNQVVLLFRILLAFRQGKGFKNWAKIEKRHDLLPMDHKDLALLAWFSNGYFNLSPTKNSTEFVFDDLRYPLLNLRCVNDLILVYPETGQGPLGY
jgi:hypothetical protein